MSQPSQPPPLSLLRLHEADIVRLCGLAAAALGMDLLSRRLLLQPQRVGARLSAVTAAPTTQAGATPTQAWAELTGEPPSVTLRWGCSVHAADGASERPGCEHIAALLAAWVRDPADFVTPLAELEAPSATAATRTSSSPTPSATTPAEPRERERGPMQPRLLTAPRQSRPQAPQTLGDELRRLPAQEASAIARRALGMELDDAEARARLETALCDRALLRTLLARLDPEAGETLAWLRLAGGALTAADVEALAARAGRPASSVRAALTTLERHGLVFATLLGAAPDTSPSGASIASAASATGGAAGDAPGWRRLRGWRLAPETRDALPRTLPIAAHERPERTERLGAEGMEAGQRRRLRVEAGSARALLLALALLARAPAPLGPFAASASGASSASSMGTGAGTGATGGRGLADGGEPRPLAEAPGRRGRAGAALAPEDLPDAQAQELARGVGVDAAILRLARRTLLWARERQAAQPVTDLARAPTPARLYAFRAGFRVWLTAQSAADLLDLERQTHSVRLRYDHTHDAFRPAALAEEAASARASVVGLLAQARPGAWHSVRDLLDLLWRVNPWFLRARQMTFSAPVWRIERISDGRPLRPTVRAEWDAAEGAYVRALLLGPLRWWGALDLASDADHADNLQAEGAAPRFFRLTPLGLFLLSRANETAAQQETGASDTAEAAGASEIERRASAALSFDWGPLATPTREGALAAHPLAAPPALLDLLERWARVTALAGGRLIYSFNADQACANFDRGQRPEDALRPLRALGLTRAAQSLAPRLQGWRDGYGDARLRMDVALVEGRDEATLREALATLPAVAPRARWLSPTLVTLGQADGAALREALARRGWEP